MYPERMETETAAPPAERPGASNFGRVIARGYWQKTDHVFMSPGSAGEQGCVLCDWIEDFGPHIAPPPPWPPSTVVEVIDLVARRERMLMPRTPNDGYGYSFQVVMSCAHNVNMATTPDKVPSVGDVRDCWSCEGIGHDAKWPPLPQEILQQITEALPKCPTCGAAIKTVEFESVRTHSMVHQLDGYSGETEISTYYEDTIYVAPHYRDSSSKAVQAKCENHHYWWEPRLVLRGGLGGGDELWDLLPPLVPPNHCGEPMQVCIEDNRMRPTFNKQVWWCPHCFEHGRALTADELTVAGLGHGT